MSETAIEIIKLCFTILPFVAVSFCIWQSGSARDKEHPHTRVIWLLWAIIWMLVIVADGVGVGL